MTNLGTLALREKMRGVMEVSEYKARWLRGRPTADTSVVLEISFEMVAGFLPLPGTRISYIGAWRNAQVLIEYQLGALIVEPDQSSWMILGPVIDRLRNYRPMTFEENDVTRDNEGISVDRYLRLGRAVGRRP